MGRTTFILCGVMLAFAVADCSAQFTSIPSSCVVGGGNLGYTIALGNFDLLNTEIMSVASAAAVVMIGMQALKWTTETDPAGRESARKGIIYVVLGLALMMSAGGIVGFLLC
ncbi:Uncharacterised protein [uncultured archaeon]|nr:Uncharacterised protein [uncultured archaeon]